MISDAFDWADVADDIVIPEQPETAVYTNPKGGVVIRQAGQFGTDDDHWVYLDRRFAVDIAKAILEKAGRDDLEIVPVSQVRVLAGDAGDLVSDSDKTADAKPDRTAAERQRRHRGKKQREREGVTEGVTQRDTVTAPLIPEFDLQNGGPAKALAN
jgi:hypothetical protein